jgi:HrpA-like RNA helicase
MYINNFIDIDFSTLIKQNVVKYTFPKLNIIEQDLLHKYLCDLVQFIAIVHNMFDPEKNFITKLKMNNYKDLRWLLLSLLPHINTDADKTKIYSLNDIYVRQHDENIDIDKEEPKFVYSNIQYGRHKRSSKNTFIEFDKSHLEENYYFLLHAIKESRNKLHVNWIEVLPVTNNEINITEKLEYIDPIKSYVEHIKSYVEQTDITDLRNKFKNNINIEDVYNTITTSLYDNIRDCRWLIFDCAINSNNNFVIKPLIQTLEIVFDNTLQYIIDNKSEKIPNNIIDDIDKRWKRFLSNYEQNITWIHIQDNLSIDTLTMDVIIKSIIIFFNKENETKTKIKYTRPENLIYKEYTEDEKLTDPNYISKNLILTTAKSIKIQDIIDFLNFNIKFLKKSWYGYMLFDNNILKSEDILIDTYVINLKNIYNYCKCFLTYIVVNNEKRKIQTLPKKWCSLGSDEIKLIEERININFQEKNIDIRWFKIDTNLKHKELLKHNTEFDKINELTKEILIEIQSYIRKIVVMSLKNRGVLSYLTFENLDFRDNSKYNITNTDDEIKLKTEIYEKYKDNTQYNEAKYYLTNEQYTPTYFETLKEYTWTFMTSFHWIAQINFVTKFINNRINYITAGTGAGKTTQIPKLYLYYYKSLEYKDDATIIISVPRTNISIGTSKRVAQELGIFENTQDIIIQKRTSKEDTLTKGNYPKIQFITDGVVVNWVKNPFLRFFEPLKINKANNEQIEDKYLIFREANIIGDCIIIDEAHEHNKNMDIILSLLNNCLKHENRVKVCIMSATIDSDEPAYRRFYRSINDNLKYPLSKWIETYKLDRINVDRRLHVAQPDEIIHKITEHFMPDKKDDPAKIGDVIKSIISTSSYGDILLFMPGTAEIYSIIEMLNSDNYLPDDVIAVPYHASLKNIYKEFIENIDKKRDIFKIKKSSNIDFKGIDKIEKFSNSQINPYKRFIIVSTNVAEASITIKTLKFVVDTGTQKNLVYNTENRNSFIQTSYITEDSRKQRRGRVGRVSSGDAYFLYDHDDVKTNKKQYNIAISDISLDVLLDLLKIKQDIPIVSKSVKNILLGKKLTDEDTKFLEQPFKDTLFKHKEYGTTKDHYEKYMEELRKIINSQYTLKNKLYTYYGNNTHYDYDYDRNDKNVYNTYISGFHKSQLNDANGKFYLIHPEELNIKRNIAGEIVSSNKINSDKMISFWLILLNYGFIGVNVKNNKKTMFKNSWGKFFTQFNSRITTIFEKFSYARHIFFAKLIMSSDKTFDEFINIIALLTISSGNIENIYNFSYLDNSTLSNYKKNEQKKQEIHKLFSIIDMNNKTDNKSDIETYKLLAKKLKQLESKVISQLRIYTNETIDRNILEGEQVIEEDDIEDKITKENTTKEEKQRKQYRQNRKNDKLFETLTNILRGSHIDVKKLMKFYKTSASIKNLWESVFTKTQTKFFKRDNYSYSALLIKYNINPYTAIFLLANPYNILHKCKNTNSFFYVFNPSILELRVIDTKTTTVDSKFHNEYIFIITENINTKKINTLMSVSLNDLQLVANIYRYTSYFIKYNYQNITLKLGDVLSKFSYTNNEDVGVSNNLVYTIKFVIEQLKENSTSHTNTLVKELHKEFDDYDLMLDRII